MGVVSLSNTHTGVDTGYVRQEMKSEGTRRGTFFKSFKKRVRISLVNCAPSLPTSISCIKEDYSLRVKGRRVGGREGMRHNVCAGIFVHDNISARISAE